MTQNLEVQAPGSKQLTEQPPPSEGQEPKSASAKYMALLWCEIIGLDQILLTQRFLDVGGNSLTLNIILNRIETERGVSLEPQLFFDEERSSLLALAEELDAALAGNPTGSPNTTPVFRCAT